MATFTDQLGREISLDERPKKIISLVPSQTELLYDLGLRDEITGITKFCVHPETWFKSKPKIGGTKNIDFEKVKQLNPDLIIGNKEENDRKQVEELMKHYPVWMSDIKNLDDALVMIEKTGELTGKVEAGAAIKNSIILKFELLESQRSILKPEISAAYLIWKKPLITVGGDTFIHDMLTRSGLINCYGSRSRYPEISEKELSDADPGLILLSSEPYPFKEQNIEEFRLLCPKAKILVADGEMFSWYGSRLIKACDYIRNLIEFIHKNEA